MWRWCNLQVGSTVVAELALRWQALLELQLQVQVQLQAEELQQAGREQMDEGPRVECGRPAETELYAAGFAALGLQGSLGLAPAAGPEPDQDAHEVAGLWPERCGWGTKIR